MSLILTVEHHALTNYNSVMRPKDVNRMARLILSDLSLPCMLRQICQNI